MQPRAPLFAEIATDDADVSIELRVVDTLFVFAPRESHPRRNAGRAAEQRTDDRRRRTRNRPGGV